MKATCDRCGRPLSAATTSGVGTHAALTCACGHTLPAQAAAPAVPARATADPLPPPREGNIEIDPWSTPPPAGGYENLVLDDAPAAGTATPEAASVPSPAEPEPDQAAEPMAAERAEPTDQGERPRSRAALGIAIAAGVVVVAGAGGWLLLGRTPTAPAGRARVTVTQEIAWNANPPLAPVDPSYVERARPEPEPPPAPAPTPSPARPASSYAGPSRATASGARPSAAPPAPAAAPPEPVVAPGGAAPPPELVAEPAAQENAPAPAAPSAPAATASAAIPLPPPPVLKQPASTGEASGRATAPVLRTRTCVEDALRIPRAAEDRLPPEVVLRVAVGEDGRPGDVSYPGNLDPQLRGAISLAVRTCRFTPGSDANGRPAAGSATMRLRFE